MNEAPGDIELGQAATPQGSSGVDDVPNIDVEEGKIGQGFLKPIPETTPLERVAGICAIGAVICSLLAMILEGGAGIVIVAGLLSMMVSPYAYWQQVRLTDIRVLLETERKLQEQVDRLTNENKRLSQNIGNLTESVGRLNDVADALKVITEKEGITVQTFSKQVEDQRQILKSMKLNVKAQVIDNLLSLAFGADQDNDSTIDQTEAEKLLRVIQEMPGVQVNQEMFLAKISGQSSDKMIDIIENVLKEDLPIEQRMFTFTEVVEK